MRMVFLERRDASRRVLHRGADELDLPVVVVPGGKHRKLSGAWPAPGRPEVQDHGAAALLRHVDLGAVERLDGEVRGGASEQLRARKRSVLQTPREREQ